MISMKNLARWLFQDDTGKYVIGQPPNLPIYLMLVGFIVSWVASGGIVNTAADLLFFGAAFTWSYLEIGFGDSKIRRILGAIVLVAIFASRLV